MGTKAHRAFQQPRRRRGLSGLPADIRAKIGSDGSRSDYHLVTIDAGHLDQEVARLTDDFCEVVIEELGPAPVAEQLQQIFAIWRRKRRSEGVSDSVLELVVGRASTRLNIGEALPA